ncbi:MAG: BrnT family toxin, partial [Polyangiaceae bacterium]|nr:BrnT family toxin [Polyangiaceae bacterium]
MLFVWDPEKAAGNERKHHVTFDEAVTVFADPLALILEDARHPERSLIIGLSIDRKTLLVVFIEVDDDCTRLISARRATRHERRR